MKMTGKKILSQLTLVLICLAFLVILFFVGIFIGYVFLGKGHPSEAFNVANFQHIMDFIK
ncbi:DNA-directed RNA polymerase subunit beta [Vagococcus silagei]|uniref:DNA-directed RNA polymerase subunit beta n=1 Tax=Vagococcus silagei TaxID=2508885 RepID=A0A4S3B4D6_9ENTE|nr:DNA-directed RNA polymerase subunit beta [Vagococcus silagei]THB61994.1 DNA-directed RNA polymerase subunit beta [Vagococcus silagei]